MIVLALNLTLTMIFVLQFEVNLAETPLPRPEGEEYLEECPGCQHPRS
jgi:hypothetical protein